MAAKFVPAGFEDDFSDEFMFDDEDDDIEDDQCVLPKTENSTSNNVSNAII